MNFNLNSCSAPVTMDSAETDTSVRTSTNVPKTQLCARTVSASTIRDPSGASVKWDSCIRMSATNSPASVSFFRNFWRNLSLHSLSIPQTLTSVRCSATCAFSANARTFTACSAASATRDSSWMNPAEIVRTSTSARILRPVSTALVSTRRAATSASVLRTTN